MFDASYAPSQAARRGDFLTCADLFCGIGKFHIAAANLRVNVVFACDIDEATQRAYKHIMAERKRKPERGRPMENLYPPRVDATPEEIAKAMFALPADHQWEYEQGGERKVYRCVECNKAVYYPDTLYLDGRCEDCKTALAE
jgi:formylmethanofuran dehydrogenase subunit E